MDRLLIDVDAAAKSLGIGRSSMYALMNAGDVATVVIGRRRLVTADSLRAYVDEHATTTPTADALATA